MFGGVAQFTAGVWSYRARDGLGTAMHGMWGSFWMAYGILYLLDAVGVLSIPFFGKFPELGYWFCVLAVITACGAVASLGESLGLFSVLAPLAVGSALLAGALLGGSSGLKEAAGYVLMASSFTATYTAAAMMFEGTFGRVILPLGKWSKAANKPGGVLTRPVEYEAGQPGVRQGQ